MRGKLRVIMLTCLQFMRHFDWALAQPDNPWKSTNYNGIWVQEQMWVLVTERAEEL